MSSPGRSVKSCGCSSDPRRACDLCEAGDAFAACSVACLRAHQLQAHGAAAWSDSRTRALDFLARANRQLGTSREPYASHRAHVMELVRGVAAGPSICVFGAGNGSDLDLAELCAIFDEVHLIDLDGAALVRAKSQVAPELGERIIVHAARDLSGFLDHLDDWGDQFPEETELGRQAVAAAHAIVRGVGRTFDVVLSTCVLSQLIVPYYRAWITSRSNWERLTAAIDAVHLATLAASTRSGGRAVMAFDVLSSSDAPALAGQRDQTEAQLQDWVDRAAGERNLTLRPNPATLIEQLRSPGLASLVRSPRLTPPWLWNLGDATQLVYGLLFERP